MQKEAELVCLEAIAGCPVRVKIRKELEELEVDTNPMKRLALPHEIAAGIAYLASDDASFVTGSTLFIDGGRVGNDPPKW